MRLIDADFFKEQIAAATLKENIEPKKGIALMELVDAQPTAYDVDKVVERLEANAMFSQEEDEAFLMLDDAIEIVESGGVNKDLGNQNVLV